MPQIRIKYYLQKQKDSIHFESYMLYFFLLINLDSFPFVSLQVLETLVPFAS